MFKSFCKLRCMKHTSPMDGCTKRRSFVSIAKSDYYSIRGDFVALHRILGAMGYQEGVCNHCSYVIDSHPISGNSAILTTKMGCDWRICDESDIVAIDTETGKILDSMSDGLDDTSDDGSHEIEYIPAAFIIHRGLSMKRNDIKCSIHTHMPYFTALTCLKEPYNQILPIHQTSCRFMASDYENEEIVKHACCKVVYDSGFRGIANTNDETQHICDLLSNDNNIISLGNHGICVTASCINVAFDRLYFAERAAMIQQLALQANKPLNYISDSVLLETTKEWKKTEQKYSDCHFHGIRKYYGV